MTRPCAPRRGSAPRVSLNCSSLRSVAAGLLLSAAALHAQLDFGDAPASYGTLLAADGARHTITPDLRLGALIDPEANGAPGPNANGDNAAGLNDEDGVLPTSLPTQGSVPWQRGAWTQLQVTVHLAGAFTAAKLDGWADFDGDGVFEEGAERILAGRSVADGAQLLGVFTPANAALGATYVRLRLSQNGVALPTGLAPDGEVEDYRIVVVAPSPATNVTAHTSHGQVWITWDFDPAAPAQTYEIYRSAVPVNNVAAAQRVARLYPQEYAAQNLTGELTEAFGGAAQTNFRIPDGAGGTTVLPIGRGLCVDTIRADGTWHYAVVPSGVTTITAADATPLATPLAVTFNATDLPTLHLQQTGVVGAFRLTFLNAWCDGDDAANAGLGAAFPLMANAARRCTPHLCIVFSPAAGFTGAEPRPLNFLMSGGGGNANAWLPDKDLFLNTGAAPTTGYAIALEDQTYQTVNGRPSGQNTNWLGYVSTLDPFADTDAVPSADQLPPAGSVIQPYTLRRLTWTLTKLLADPSLNLDPARVSLTAHSMGGKGAILWARAAPNLFSHVSCLDAELANTIEAGVDLRMFGTPTLPVIGGAGTVTGDNFAIAGLINAAGPVHYDDVFRPHVPLSTVRDVAPMRFYYGLHGENWLLDCDHDRYSDVQREMEFADTLGNGGLLYWDMREHGAEKWTFTSSIGGCFAPDDFWIPTTGTQTRRDDTDVVARYRSDRSYPAFHNARGNAGNPSPGTADYGAPPLYYDGFSIWPTDYPCWGRRPPVTGHANRGTWGGWCDWVTDAPPTDARALRDEAAQWACTVFLPDDVDGGGNALAAVDAAPLPALASDLAIRRPQLFTPAPGATVTWMNVDQAGRTVVQSGKVTVSADTVVRLPGIVVPRAPQLARVVAATELDFGDAPAAYPVTLAQDGARHATDTALRLGTARNVEADGTPHSLAFNSSENDDGVAAPAQLEKGTRVTLTITVSAACRLDAWIDWAQNDSWTDAADVLATSLPLAAGANTLDVYVPPAAAEGVTFARFRVSLGGGLAPTGPAPEGEVEDYPVQITAATQPTIPALQIATYGTNQAVVRWAGNPAYSAQLEHSADLKTWFTYWLPAGETSGTNEIVIPSAFMTDRKHFFRLVRRPLVTSPIPLPAPGDEITHQFLNQTFVHDGVTRRYRLKVPNNWTPLRTWPLVVMLPGHGQSAEEFWDNRSEMMALANGDDGDGDPNDGWILCFLEANSAESSYRWYTSNDPRPANPGVALQWADDYGFVRGITQALLASGLNVDPRRVFNAGFSNGGNMAHFVASKADHPFAAFAMFDSGVQFFVPDAPPGAAIPADRPLPVKPRPVLINNQLDSLAWPYEGWVQGYNFGAPSPGALGTVARWATANGVPGATADAVTYAYTLPPPTVSVSHPWDNVTGPTTRMPLVDARPDLDWPQALINANVGWTPAALSQLAFYVEPGVPLDPRTPAALRAEYPHLIAPDPTAPTGRAIVLHSTWTEKKWIPADPNNEVVLVSMGTGGHNWPEADSPWDGHVKLLEFFQSHPLPAAAAP